MNIMHSAMRNFLFLILIYLYAQPTFALDTTIILKDGEILKVDFKNYLQRSKPRRNIPNQSTRKSKNFRIPQAKEKEKI